MQLVKHGNQKAGYPLHSYLRHDFLRSGLISCNRSRVQSSEILGLPHKSEQLIREF